MKSEQNQKLPDPSPDAEPFDVASPSLPRGTRFGAIVGLFAGAGAGAASCLLVQAGSFLLPATLIAATLGCAGGAYIGAGQMRNPKKAASPDIATCICVSYSLIPAGVVLLGGAGFVAGKLHGHVLLGVAFGIPMAASLVGAVLDRIYEAGLRRRCRPDDFSPP